MASSTISSDSTNKTLLQKQSRIACFDQVDEKLSSLAAAAKVLYMYVILDVLTMEDVDACNNHHRGKYNCCSSRSQHFH
jgi:hypothetical protein